MKLPVRCSVAIPSDEFPREQRAIYPFGLEWQRINVDYEGGAVIQIRTIFRARNYSRFDRQTCGGTVEPNFRFDVP